MRHSLDRLGKLIYGCTVVGDGWYQHGAEHAGLESQARRAGLPEVSVLRAARGSNPAQASDRHSFSAFT